MWRRHHPCLWRSVQAVHDRSTTRSPITATMPTLPNLSLIAGPAPCATSTKVAWLAVAAAEEKRICSPRHSQCRNCVTCHPRDLSGRVVDGRHLHAGIVLKSTKWDVDGSSRRRVSPQALAVFKLQGPRPPEPSGHNCPRSNMGQPWKPQPYPPSPGLGPTFRDRRG